MSTRLLNNNRLFYAIEAIGFAPFSGVGTTQATLQSGFLMASGVQSVGIDTSFNIEQVFQLGQLDIYANMENIPNVEVTVEKVLDGTSLLQHLATPLTGQGSELLSRYSNQRCDVAFNVYRDYLSSASGGGALATGDANIHQCYMSGMYVSSINFNLPTDGNMTESITLVGNSKNWKAGAAVGTGIMDFRPKQSQSSAPPLSGLVMRRQNLVFGTGTTESDTNVSYLPKEIPGIDATGFNRTYALSTLATGVYAGFGAHVQSIQISADLGRTELFELGRRGPYHRYLDFPIEVTCAIEIIDTQGDSIIAREEAQSNLTDQRIYLVLEDGTNIDLGSKNRLTSVNNSGGDTGGGIRTATYNYSNFNALTVTRRAGSGVLGLGPAAPGKADPANASDEDPFEFGDVGS
jgi:hypothetical protein